MYTASTDGDPAANAAADADQENVLVAPAVPVQLLSQSGALVIMVKGDRKMVSLLHEPPDLNILDIIKIQRVDDLSFPHADGTDRRYANARYPGLPGEDLIHHLINAGDQFILGRPFTYDLHMLDDIQLYVADDRLTAATVDQKSGEARRVRRYIQSHRIPAHAFPVFLLRLDQVILGDQASDNL